ncbi:SAM-dependent methyltransferase, partial [Streptomyces nigrescens]
MRSRASGRSPPRPSSTRSPGGEGPVRDPSLRRSYTLFRAFLQERTDPGHCYRLLARDAADQVERYAPLKGAVVADIGGGSGYFT